MNKRETLILKYLSGIQNRLRLTKDHLQAEYIDEQEFTEFTDLNLPIRSSDVPEIIATYKFYLKEISLQTSQIEALIEHLEEKI